jgi:general nucleoside transport system ATP-binding protein
VAGVAGNGQRELAEGVTGMRPASSGSVDVYGQKLRTGDPRAAISAGISHVPEDRLGTGVAPGLSIAENSVLKSYRLRGISLGPLLNWGMIREVARDLILRYDVATPGPQLRARDLSGGNLQKLILGREFSSAPKVLIAASPTRGLDVGAIETVHAYLRQAAGEGVAVLLISEDLDEILALADRVVVMYEGQLTGEFDPGMVTIEEIGLAMAGGAER